MGADESKSSGSSGSASFASGAIDFPNSCRRESKIVAWTLLHQCTIDKWKEGHAGKLPMSQHHLYRPRMRIGNVFSRVRLFVCLSVCLFVCLSVCLSVCLFWL